MYGCKHVRILNGHIELGYYYVIKIDKSGNGKER